MVSPPASQNGPSGSSVNSVIDRWISEAQAGSHSALGRIFEASRKYLLLVANRTLDDGLQSKVGASDLVQDTFVEAQRDFGRFQGKTEAELFGWLTAILANRLSNNVRHYRTQKRTINRELDGQGLDDALAGLRDAALTPAAATLAQDEEQRVRQALDQLDPSLREVLIDRTWRRESFADIGAKRGATADAARKQWCRAVREMRRILEARG